ncbi:methionyl-tRNA formyltransferase [Candidatus Giovannonibacteria bacterium RIFCSPLOWO2_02_FULL_43_11b]|uniref:methionyl-tRNA formyltransferase n=1 Tax=Candidatus Giovannonibacteria bacterium RIFCSPHIGHO2_12_FULL_43_15 TaxID=1798341 RepID=A0A1F5WQ67_9BACT|nr:MAG: methionyl-tRNA formyltransferase [Candidatus Giovannonibacteria bacterium RIFCSPHIGHO2_01_FULL_43_100]OGF67307.1 MAG: methionyl-tRNA formyltransferase [Candidatus Giovannonibacteria bacterium RIFCSPHIGHO2_02_FULL_43_32]OGF77795.1 MAG: methionyl-tRNA formyltransferase [Candidatus Giovannonibacteria bacterium RIFCSPHIGHO2_12_FULL_43_15]OGF78588.1 MAG: methionyl-tRNA formyltransferase [Candidatus Giovannonibacteria bacterium RIFCSPLOWO2_01_FULL_43_60]OGF90025.1 MAG: methionyl-tRNA formyltr
MKIFFLGTSKFSKIYRDALVQAGYEIVGLEDSPDLGVIAYYGKILPKKTLDIPKMGFINVHYSLLPRWRGPSPIQAAILAGDTTTGATISKVVPKADGGEIIAQKEIPILQEETYPEIERKLDDIGPALLVKSIPDWTSGKINPREQDESKAIYSKLIKTEDGHIDWKKSSEEILCQIRALSPNPGVFTTWNGKRLLILKASPEKTTHDSSPGKVIKDGEGFKIACHNGFIKPLLIKLEGKKETTPEAFLHGHREIIGAALR